MTGMETDVRRRGSELESLLQELAGLRDEIAASGERAALDTIDPRYRASARNLFHYLALRRHDLRPLQQRLTELGLSSLGRAESHVLASLDAVLDVLRQLAQRPTQDARTAAPVDFAEGERLLAENTERLLGPASSGRAVRIMVTMPTEAAHNYQLVHDLVRLGMNCMRINCAHDDAATWAGMVHNLRRAESELHTRCRVVMDLAGPKLRTGPIEPGEAVVRIRPQRDAFGRVLANARVWLAPAVDGDVPPPDAGTTLPLPAAWIARLRPGERVALNDARGAARELAIVDVTRHGAWAEAAKTTYIVPGTVLRRRGVADDEPELEAAVGDLPAAPGKLRVAVGDLLVVTRDLVPGRPASVDSGGVLVSPATIGCTMAAVFDHAKPGEPIWFDDGKIGGTIKSVEPGRIVVLITRARANGAKLVADRGINLPDTSLSLAALTPQDLEDLEFVARHADIVELSFANTARDVEMLQRHLRQLTDHAPAIVLKIETRRGFENLPDMLLAAMRSPCCGVMIARGDLAVECGFERLAEVQEEILWICEAAHVPVIWATQVLETLAKSGVPSRAEITDAAMGDRAECVMLNKGPHVLSAVRALDDILRRMQAHQMKKRSMLRELHLAHALPADVFDALTTETHGT
ncbi:MAG TPA: pyruvate kinase [Gammaproteobacteria bacterium]|nr:pyruvate kinase [Gammaproteobacteria bacterium]